MQPDGIEQRQLTTNAASDGQPAVTPDNSYVVFISNRTDANQVWRMNIDGSNQIQLTDGSSKSYPAISTDGRWVFYNTTDDWHLWKVPIDGGEPVRLTEYVALQPAVSPGGNLLACVGRDDAKLELLILSSSGGSPLKRFCFIGWNSRIQWASDGKSVIYSADSNGLRLAKQSLNGGLPEEVVVADEDQIFDFGYSLDGHSLAVTRGGWQHDIVLLSDLNGHLP
jgi:Tol biopolymer transport system component